MALVKKSREVYALSDGTGTTCETVIRSALKQFDEGLATIHKIPNVRTGQQVREILEKVARTNGVVIYTTVSPELREKILAFGRFNNSNCYLYFTAIQTRSL